MFSRIYEDDTHPLRVPQFGGMENVSELQHRLYTQFQELIMAALIVV